MVFRKSLCTTTLHMNFLTQKRSHYTYSVPYFFQLIYPKIFSYSKNIWFYPIFNGVCVCATETDKYTEITEM